MLWQARHVEIRIGDAIPSLNTTENLWEQLDTNTSDLICAAKDAEFSEPERTADTVKLLGSVSGAQCSELDEKAASEATLTMTMILQPEADNSFDLEKYKLTATAVTATGITKRYNYASAPPTNGVAVAVKFSNGTDKVHFLLNNASVTTLGGFKIDADGHAEQEVKVTCSADDCYKESTLY